MFRCVRDGMSLCGKGVIAVALLLSPSPASTATPTEVPIPRSDCEQNESPDEQLICSNPELASIAATVEIVVAWLGTWLPETERRALHTEQQEWIGRRNADCGLNRELEDPAVRKEVAACFKKWLQDRPVELLQRAKMLRPLFGPADPPSGSAPPREFGTWELLVRSSVAASPAATDPSDESLVLGVAECPSRARQLVTRDQLLRSRGGDGAIPVFHGAVSVLASATDLDVLTCHAGQEPGEGYVLLADRLLLHQRGLYGRIAPAPQPSRTRRSTQP